MTRSNWIAGAAIVLVVLALTLTFDPLGFWADPTPDPAERAAAPYAIQEVGLEGMGKKPMPDQDPATWEGEPVGVLDLGLGTAGLTGVVRTEDTPIRFARVQPVLAPPHENAAVRTRKDGTWEIRGLPAGQYDVRATHPDYVGRTVVSPRVGQNETAEVEPIVLSPRPDRTDAIVVKVTDAYGRPIPGANVLATTLQWDLHLAMGPEMAGQRDVLHKSGKTDETGRVRLGPLVPEDYNVVAWAKGYVNQAINNVVVSSGRVRHVTIRLAESLAIRGRVEDAEGNGIGGAVVMGMAQPSFHSSLTTHSDADGTFVLDGLRRGGYMLIAWEETAGTVMTTGTAPDHDVKLTVEGTGRLKGKAVWPDGSPVTAGRIRPFQTGPFQYEYSLVREIGSDGTFDLHMPKGNYNLRVQAQSGEMSADTVAKVSVGETTEITITVPKTGVVRGVVMDESGRHLEGAEVYVNRGGMPGGPSREQYARSDADGLFEVPGLPFQAVKLHVVHPEFADMEVEATPQPAGQAKQISVRMGAGATVTGTVTSAGGGALAGEQVNLVVNWFNARSTHTDGGGRYTFTAVAPGDYTMTTGPYEQGARGLSKGGIHVGTAGTVTVDFEYPAVGGRLTGEVRLGGTGVPDAQVRIQDGRGPEAAITVRTDEGGRFEADGLQYGRVTVFATAAGGMEGVTRATVEEDAASHCVLEIGTASVRARIVDDEGNPVPGCWINTEIASPEDTGWSRVKDNGNSNSSGVYEAKGLQAGTYVLRVNRVEYAQYVSPPFTLAEGEAKDLGDVPMTRGVLLSGHVHDDAGAPIEKATVSLEDAQGRPVFLFSMATTGSDGRYSLHGVEPGRYTVRFEAKGHGPDEKAVSIGAEGATADGVLTRGGTVAVLVEDESGRPLAGARVKLIDARGQVVTRTISMANFDSGRRTTDGQGRTSLADLAGGTYTVRCELAGHVLLDEPPRVFVRPGETAETRVVMQAGP
jgi:protocatechuate 3,4-dioxygenase beta subunit